jgi:hypothetical protein
LEADEPEEDEEEELPVHMRHNDPFLIPAVPSVLRLVGRQEEQSPLPQQQEQQQNPSCSQVLAIQLAGEAALTGCATMGWATMRHNGLGRHVPLQRQDVPAAPCLLCSTTDGFSQQLLPMHHTARL